MQIESLEKITPKILRRYNRNPHGWRFLVDTNKHIRSLGPGVCYRLKIVSWTPRRQVGVGVRVKLPENVEAFVKQLRLPQYGFRILRESTVKALLSAAIRTRGVVPQQVMQELLQPSTVALDDLAKAKYVMEGVRVQLGQPLSSIIAGQEELETRLEQETNKLLRRKFPLSWASYV